MNPKYPIYIPSKGRYDTRLTIRALDRINVPYRVVIEQQEYDQYAQHMEPSKLLVLPFSNRGLIASRCWIMEHSISEGHKRHWQLDDNIREFYRLNRNIKARFSDGVGFRASEDFVDRYKNIAYSGFQYEMFANRRASHPPMIINTRIYSCTLVNNSIPYRWRSIYNDDTDVCLMALKDGWCTVLFYAFLAEKEATMTIKGGNTEDLYLIEDGRLKMAKALQELHPDVVTIRRKWGRWQHHVDYTPFKKNTLVPVEGFEAKDGINNYGMRLVNIEEEPKD